MNLVPRSFCCFVSVFFFFFTLSLFFILPLSAFASSNLEGIQVYHTNLSLSPLHKKKLAADISYYRTANNLWDILREDFSLYHYENYPPVQNKIEWFMNNQIFLLQAASRAAPYLYYISQQVKKRHLPAEMVLLPIIESGYNPFAISNMGASGIWQMMPGTATGFGVRQDAWYDGRRDIIASTHAALNYLIYLQNFFSGNWLLAIAAYNTGEGNVLTAIKRNVREGRRTDFWSLPVAQQTRDYVPSLLALAVIISHPEEYPIYLPPIRNAPYLAQVEVNKQVNLKYAADLAGLSFKRLIQLNPGFNRLKARASYQLVLPIENVEKFSENLARSPFNMINMKIIWIRYKIKFGDSLFSIAKKFNTNAWILKKINHLNKNSLQAGVTLFIPNQSKANAFTKNSSQFTFAAHKLKYAITSQKSIHSKAKLAVKPFFIFPQTKYILQPGDTIYMVRRGDSLSSIGRRFKMSSTTLLAANPSVRKMPQAGKQIIIPTHLPLESKQNNIMSGEKMYIVRKGDTIEKIASKFRTTPGAIRLANLIDQDVLLEGEKLVVPEQLHG